MENLVIQVLLETQAAMVSMVALVNMGILALMVSLE